MKIKFLICLVLVLVVLVSGCSLEQERNVNDETEHGKMEKKVFIDLEYLTCVEDFDLSDWYGYSYIDEDTEFTWWERRALQIDGDLSGSFKINDEVYKFDLPENIDTAAEKDCIISYGRKLKYLYYYTDIYVYENGPEGYYARPVFEREYNGKVAYIYLIDRIKLTDNEFYGKDLREFNEKGNIPFELPPEG